MSGCSPIMISVKWDHTDLEVRTISALAEVMLRAKQEGMKPEQQERVTAYLAKRCEVLQPIAPNET
jgi:hypothetical protein